MRRKQLQDTILNWYDQNKRILPWRDDPSAYHVWISEIMLQQTRVEAVIGYYNTFIAELPTVKDLAEVSEDRLLKLWQGLGYYNRARNLKKAATIIMNRYQGEIPTSKEGLLSLPGIGPYTSGAILSIAFGVKEAAIDGNVLRVFVRYLNLFGSIEDTEIKQQVREFVTSLLPSSRNSEFTQSLMEIGAIICLPNGMPKCNICPLQSTCLARLEQTVAILPLPREKKIKPVVKRTVIILKQGDAFWIQQRPNKGLLASLFEFKMIEEHKSVEDLHSFFKHENINILKIQKLPKSQHLFTHLKWDLIGYMVEIEPTSILNMILVNKEALLNQYSIPSAYKTYVNYIMELNDKNS